MSWCLLRLHVSTDHNNAISTRCIIVDYSRVHICALVVTAVVLEESLEPMYRIHAASVLHQAEQLINCEGGLSDVGIVEDLLAAAMMLAAICHDFDHPG